MFKLKTNWINIKEKLGIVHDLCDLLFYTKSMREKLGINGQTLPDYQEDYDKANKWKII